MLVSIMLIKDIEYFEKKSFIKCENLPIDISVFEKTKKAYVIPLDCGWDDVGSWETLWRILKKDKKGNSFKGKILASHTKDSLTKCEDKFVVGLGLENIIFVDTKNAVLVDNL